VALRRQLSMRAELLSPAPLALTSVTLTSVMWRPTVSMPRLKGRLRQRAQTGGRC